MSRSRMNYELYGSILSTAIDPQSKALLGVRGPKDFDKKYTPEIRRILKMNDMGKLKSVVVSHVGGTLDAPDDEMVRLNVESFSDVINPNIFGGGRRSRQFITFMVQDHEIVTESWQKEMLDRNGLLARVVGQDGKRDIKGYIKTRIQQRWGVSQQGFIYRIPAIRYVRGHEGILVRLDNTDYAIRKDTKRDTFFVNMNEPCITYSSVIARNLNPFTLTPGFAE